MRDLVCGDLMLGGRSGRREALAAQMEELGLGYTPEERMVPLCFRLDFGQRRAQNSGDFARKTVLLNIVQDILFDFQVTPWSFFPEENMFFTAFPLSEISSLLHLSEQELARRIHARRLQAHRELTEMRKAIRRMEEDVIRMEELDMEAYPVILMDCPEYKVFGLRRTIDVSQTHELFQDLKAELNKRGLRLAGFTQQMYHGKEFSYEAMDVEAQAQVEADGPEIRTVPAGTYAAVTHNGPYESLRYAYDALAKWLGGHPEYRVCGPAVERYLKDEDSVESPEELETGVLFPVEKIR